MDSFLCNRQQRIEVNGAKSQWAPVLSGGPQGTVIGLLLFFLYINYIMVGIESEIRLFAADCVCYRYELCTGTVSSQGRVKTRPDFFSDVASMCLWCPAVLKIWAQLFKASLT